MSLAGECTTTSRTVPTPPTIPTPPTVPTLPRPTVVAPGCIYFTDCDYYKSTPEADSLAQPSDQCLVFSNTRSTHRGQWYRRCPRYICFLNDTISGHLSIYSLAFCS